MVSLLTFRGLRTIPPFLSSLSEGIKEIFALLFLGIFQSLFPPSQVMLLIGIGTLSFSFVLLYAPSGLAHLKKGGKILLFLVAFLSLLALSMEFFFSPHPLTKSTKISIPSSFPTIKPLGKEEASNIPVSNIMNLISPKEEPQTGVPLILGTLRGGLPVIYALTSHHRRKISLNSFGQEGCISWKHAVVRKEDLETIPFPVIHVLRHPLTMVYSSVKKGLQDRNDEEEKKLREELLPKYNTDGNVEENALQHWVEWHTLIYQKFPDALRVHLEAFDPWILKTFVLREFPLTKSFSNKHTSLEFEQIVTDLLLSPPL